MKKLFLFSTLILTPILAAQVPVGNQYVSLHGGGDFLHSTSGSDHGEKVGFKVGGAYGYKWLNGMRAEFELAYRDNNKRTKYTYTDIGPDQKTHISNHSMSYMANLCYDIGSLNTYGLTPFIGAGVGVCSNTYRLKTQVAGVTTNTDHGKDDRFAWQLLAGAKYPLAMQMELAAEYKYFVGQYHGRNHSVTAALIRSF